MDWKTLIEDLQAQKMTLQAIADLVGMSRGAIHDLKTGRGKTVFYETGVAIVTLHKRELAKVKNREKRK